MFTQESSYILILERWNKQLRQNIEWFAKLNTTKTTYLSIFIKRKITSLKILRHMSYKDGKITLKEMLKLLVRLYKSFVVSYI